MEITKVAITGTKGKTTVMFIVNYVLRSLKFNTLTASSTEGVYYNETFLRHANWDSYMSMYTKSTQPYDFYLSEATSKLLKYDKYLDKHVDIAVFTNIEKYEHSETHKTFLDYLNSKKKLFDIISNKGKLAIVNKNDKYYQHMLRDYVGKVIYVENLKILTQSAGNMEFSIKHNNEAILFQTKLTGDYNAMNFSIAFFILLNLGINKNDIIKFFKSFSGVPGRFEVMYTKYGPVVIDYAHTPRSIKLVLNNIKNIYNKKIITVVGAGGQRSSDKRPIMGKVAYELSDILILTEDNSRNEDPLHIISDIKLGIRNIDNSKLATKLPRYDAIKYALNLQNKNKEYIIAILGKGVEKGIITNRPKTWKDTLTDKQIVEDVCKKQG